MVEKLKGNKVQILCLHASIAIILCKYCSVSYSIASLIGNLEIITIIKIFIYCYNNIIIYIIRDCVFCVIPIYCHLADF